MEREAVVYTMSSAPTAIVLERIDDKRLITAWSSDGETRYLQIDNNGEAVGESRRVDRQPFAGKSMEADGGVKTFWPAKERLSLNAEVLCLEVVNSETVVLGVLEQANSNSRGGAYAIVIELAGDQGVHLVYLGEVGEFASGIAMAVVGESVYTAWHEGRSDSSLVRLARIDVNTREIKARGVIPGGRAAANPALAARGEKILIAWQETHHNEDSVGAEVKVSPLTTDLKLGKSTLVARCRLMDTTPTLERVKDNFGLAYRDNADDDDKPEFYFAMIGHDGAVMSPPARISRADGYQGPNIAHGDPLVFSAQIRSFQHNYLVGMNRFDLKGVKQGGEFQIYADKSDFIRVALEAQGSEVLLVYGEDRHGSGRILFGKVICKAK